MFLDKGDTRCKKRFGNESQEYDDDSATDIEEEYKGDSQAPFDPAEIRMSRRTISLDSLIKRLKHNELNLSPDFQREKSIWPRGAQSRLIESLLIRVPIPASYFDTLQTCLLYTSPSPRDRTRSRMPSSA